LRKYNICTRIMIYKKDKAFTLIELLVVISVISLLLAILMPALSAAKSETRAIVCKSNIRQLLLASNGYANEHDGSRKNSIRQKAPSLNT
jgi:prepilin-type N-terminal cleavage/methylation domain-containing protein